MENHGLKPVHFSTLKMMSLSPSHYRWAVDHKREETRAMKVGSVVHALVLGGHYWVFNGERRGHVWTDFRDTHQDGATIVTASEFEDAKAIAWAALSNPDVQRLAKIPHQTEQQIAWQWLGRDCAGRVDVIWPEMIGELKVTNSAELERFGRQAIAWHYHAQLRWYQIGLGRPQTSGAVIIAVEDKPPYPVTVRPLTERVLEAGEKQCRLWMEQLLCAEQANVWPGYASSPVPLDLPEWIGNQEEAA